MGFWFLQIWCFVFVDSIWPVSNPRKMLRKKTSDLPPTKDESHLQTKIEGARSTKIIEKNDTRKHKQSVLLYDFWNTLVPKM